MYGDTDVIRRHVGRLREQGTDIRSLADTLVGQVENIPWSGRAAESMRERVRERATHLREVAARHDDAAESLEEHLEEVDLSKESIADVERRVEALVADARTRIARIGAYDDPAGVTRLPDPADEELAAAELPAPGHKDWLVLDLPGL